LLTDHQHFEELCALVASGQASEDHLLEWQEHAQECAECRSLRKDFEQTARAIVVSDNKRAPRYNVPAGMTERFVAHARSAGVPLSRNGAAKQLHVRSFRRLAFSTAAAAALAALIAFLFWFFGTGPNGFPLFKKFYGVNSSSHTYPVDDPGVESTWLQDNLQLQEQVRDAQAERMVLVKQLRDMRQMLELAERKSVEINARLDELQHQNAQARGEEKGRVDEIAQLREQMERVSSQRNSYHAATLVLESQLTRMRNKVEELSSELEEAQQLNAAANQAKDLIVARNLHIVDVHDANEDGHQQRAFGRIFYTEGKSLVFYAYDLADPKSLNAKINFYVWGEKLGKTHPLKSLGIFHADNKTERRWVLTFDDPRVLAEIDSVFVTAESEKRPIKQPRGKKILYAYFGDKPNHP
jgi:archaellum component FlaC